MSKGERPKAYCTILAGPNGSGKSTIYSLLSPVGEFVNADVVARKLDPANPEAVSMAAGRLILAKLDSILSELGSFVYETTLSSRQSLALMERCRAQRYEIALVYVALDSPDLNVDRVAERVIAGGHDIEEAVIRRRYETAFNRLPTAFKISDTILIFDNSGLEPLMVIGAKHGKIFENHLDSSNAFHLRLATALANGLDIPSDSILKKS